jgi:hypothetical protein
MDIVEQLERSAKTLERLSECNRDASRMMMESLGRIALGECADPRREAIATLRGLMPFMDEIRELMKEVTP